MLKDRFLADIDRVFLNEEHFADEHTWNGHPITITQDAETLLKRKNNNVNDISWDNNSDEILFYAKVAGFPGRVQPNDSVLFDMRPMRVMSVQDDEGMYTIHLVSGTMRVGGADY